jgi:hypothetical protein
MQDSQFTKLLTQTARAASRHHDLIAKVDNECQRRYGCSYSDVDADGIIDMLDYSGGSEFSASEFDEEMNRAGVQRVA